MTALCAALLLVLVVVAPAAAAPDPRVVISSPGDGAYVSGAVIVKANVEPAYAGVARLNFIADGRPVCSLVAPPYECGWDAGEGIEPHVVRVVALLRDGRRRVATIRTRGSVFVTGTDVRLVQVTATVTDSGGHFVKGLTPTAFRVYEDDVLQAVSHFIGPGGSKELVSCIDISSSMAPAMSGLKRAVRGFLEALTPEDRVSLLAFNDNIFTLASRDADHAARLRTIDRLAPWGGTALYDTLLQGLKLVSERRGRKALVVFTDGEDQSSFAAVEDVVRRVEISDAPVYMIGQGRGTRVPELKRLLDRLARISGGRAFYTDRIEELQGAYGEIVEELSNQYLLAYDPSHKMCDGSWRSIRVELVGLDHRVRARQGYRAVKTHDDDRRIR